MQRLSVLCLVFLGLLALPIHLSAAPPVSQVEVVNEPLQVTGTVEVTNEPVEVTGAVEVSNLPQPNAPPRFQLVGFTSATFLGDTGVLGFTLACQAEFPASRMCNSVEVMETVDVPASLPADVGGAWVRPVFQPVSYNQQALEASGVAVSGGTSNDAVRQMSCTGWSSGSGPARGLAVTSDGTFRLSTCAARPIACCALVP